MGLGYKKKIEKKKKLPGKRVPSRFFRDPGFPLFEARNSGFLRKIEARTEIESTGRRWEAKNNLWLLTKILVKVRSSYWKRGHIVREFYAPQPSGPLFTSLIFCISAGSFLQEIRRIN